MSLKRFTRPDGMAVLVNPEQVAVVRLPMEGDPPNSRAIIVMESGGFQGVRETIAEVEERLK